MHALGKAFQDSVHVITITLNNMSCMESIALQSKVEVTKSGFSISLAETEIMFS